VVDDEIPHVGSPADVEQDQLLAGNVADYLLGLPGIELERQVVALLVGSHYGSSLDSLLEQLLLPE
jgi:hypothetical protein